VKTLLPIAAAALLALAPLTGAQAQEPARGETASSPFDILDADRSGSLNTREGQGHPVVAQNFAAADANSDGSLSREEFNTAFTTREPAAAPPPAASAPESPEPPL
jgi:hypothetical protein